MLRFNPTLVRLRRVAVRLGFEAPPKPFQSHAGSIEATAIWTRGRERKVGFNPTLVRLRRLPTQEAQAQSPMFQSHAGSIEAWRWVAAAGGQTCFNPTLVRLRQELDREVIEQLVSFNPTLVRLRPAALLLAVLILYIVSIPRWFD